MPQPRPYQQAAVDAVWDYLANRAGNPCVVLPTGAGKSLVLAMLASHAAKVWGGRVGVIAHVKELVEQNAEEIRRHSSGVKVGIYSAGLNKRDTKADILVAGIQSIYQRAFDIGGFDLLLIDECHLIPPSGDGMYRQYITDCLTMRPHVRVIGLTATPYRTSTGMVVGDDQILTDICYEASVLDLIQQGYLSPLISREGEACDTSGLHIRGGEFVDAEASELMLSRAVEACDTLASKTAGRNSVLVFTQGIQHCQRVADLLRAKDMGRVEVVTGDTPAAERAKYVTEFRAGSIRYLVNVNVLTTGFNAPNVDCVALLRPTMSPGLYYQMVGRGFRLAPGKDNCLVLDFGGNIKRHGPIDMVQPQRGKAPSVANGEPPTKCCPACQTFVAIAATTCEHCGHEFPPPQATVHDTRPDGRPITSNQIVRTEHKVLDTLYTLHRKRNAPDAVPVMRVEHRISQWESVSEWICLEHEGYARRKAEAWWRARSNDPIPASVEHAVDIANAGGLAQTLCVTCAIKGGSKYPEIVRCEIGPKPEGVPAGADDFELPAPPEPVQDAADIDYSKYFDDAPF